jgi:hypothetical protein
LQNRKREISLVSAKLQLGFVAIIAVHFMIADISCRVVSETMGERQCPSRLNCQAFRSLLDEQMAIYMNTSQFLDHSLASLLISRAKAVWKDFTGFS